MDAVWASEAPVACIHPGWNTLTGRDAVMDSWRTILESAGRPKIRCRDAEAFVFGDAAFVTCYEDVNQGVLAATNVFVRESGTWRMVHHQAGPTASQRPQERQARPDTVH